MAFLPSCRCSESVDGAQVVDISTQRRLAWIFYFSRGVQALFVINTNEFLLLALAINILTLFSSLCCILRAAVLG